MGRVVLIFVFLLFIFHHLQVKMLYFIQGCKPLCNIVKGSISNKIKVTNVLCSQSLDKGKHPLRLFSSLRASSLVLRPHFSQSFPLGRSSQHLPVTALVNAGPSSEKVASLWLKNFHSFLSPVKSHSKPNQGSPPKRNLSATSIFAFQKQDFFAS